MTRPRQWVRRVNAAPNRKEQEAMERSMRKSCPYGEALWREELARRLGLEHTLREGGRPPEGRRAGG